ncbi:hypothetical protein AKO1_002776 [Acrasis kona]|uniref:Uncharacterized protein n=1 Tax=Acrasis kona TaxID=1008807 RepID=A0AAW2YHQ3_9EUKA
MSETMDRYSTRSTEKFFVDISNQPTTLYITPRRVFNLSNEEQQGKLQNIFSQEQICSYMCNFVRGIECTTITEQQNI